MRVLVLASYAPSLVRFRGPLIERLGQKGHDVHVCAPDIDPTVRENVEALGATVHSIYMDRTGMSILTDIRYLISLRRLMLQVVPDLVLTYTIKPNIWGAFAAASLRIQSVAIVTGLGYAFSDSAPTGLKTRFIGGLARYLYQFATARNWRVIFQNPNDRDDFIAAGCLADPRKARMINGSGVDLDEFIPTPLPALPDFLMIARLLRAKGVREYSLAAIAVKRTHPLARFRLVGFFDGGPDEITHTELGEWVSGGLEYLGFSHDVRPHLAAARVYVLPSYREGTPRSVLEAMAMQRPILTTDVPGCRETVQNGVNGFLVPAQDVEVLAEKMRWMIEHSQLCEKMASESLRIVREKYDVNSVNDSLLRHLGLE